MSSTGLSSPVASSSSVKLPRPGKSILKRRAAPPPTLFSRISKFLPVPQADEASPSNLKRAHFCVPHLTTVYPVSTSNAPTSASVLEEKHHVEIAEAERRKKVLSEDWSMDGFYRECCKGRDEELDPIVEAAMKKFSKGTLDLSGVRMTAGQAAALSDVFAIEWGIRKLVMRECELDARVLKPILHALLIPKTLTFLSLASNRNLKQNAWKLVAAYVAKADLQFLDLSSNALDKKSVEYLVSTLNVVSLRLDECSLKPTALDVLSHSVRTSNLRNISLRHNKINATGAVALAVLMKDYPDVAPTPLPARPSLSSTFTAVQTTTYTPYVPRSRRDVSSSTPPTPTLSAPLPPPSPGPPLIMSSRQGGIVARHAPPPSSTTPTLLDKVRALDNLPRLGDLRTLDLKGNDIRTGIVYLAQVLKRNRTLRILNLSDNKIDAAGLALVAESLKYNTVLETLDLSRNPCAGPGLEGIQALRQTLPLNSSLRRLFLSSTQLTPLAAIALAEFLPESTSLLHIDLTENLGMGLAGVMALNEGLKSNWVVRCLDLDVPPGEGEYSRMCREILETCIRNSEEAERIFRLKVQQKHEEDAKNEQKKKPKAVWGMVEESALARSLSAGTPGGLEALAMTHHDSNGGSEDSNTKEPTLGRPQVSIVTTTVPNGCSGDGEQTPRANNGKGKAKADPHEIEDGHSVDEVETETEPETEGEADDGGRSPSAAEISRSWVQEEGEIFRKGTVLLQKVGEEVEVDTEELKVGILETEVARPPPRSLSFDEFDEVPAEGDHQDTGSGFNTPTTLSPTIGSPNLRFGALEISPIHSPNLSPNLSPNVLTRGLPQTNPNGGELLGTTQGQNGLGFAYLARKTAGGGQAPG